MNIGGFQKISLIDYPGNISAVVFTRGCNFRCSFCHNPELVIPELFGQLVQELDFFTFLEKRTKQLDGIVITGGEPAIQKDLPDFIAKIKKMGYKVKLDTNGTYSDVLEYLLFKKQLDYVAMDIKAPREKYAKVSGVNVDTAAIDKSIRLIKTAGIDYTFRTTVVKKHLSIADLKEIYEWIERDKNYILQNANLTGKVLNPELKMESQYTSLEVSHIRAELDSNGHF